MKLSDHFTLEEFTISQTAAREGIDNTPPYEVIERLKRTAMGLEGVRMLLGAPISISSGYRSPELNKAVKGAKDSHHVTGDAADFICPGFGSVDNVVRRIKESGMAFDQLINEFDRWVHISFHQPMRNQVLRIDSSGTRQW